MSDYIPYAAIFIPVIWFLVKTVRWWLGQPERKEEELVPNNSVVKPEYSDFKGKFWRFKIAGKDPEGGNGISSDNLTNVLLQEIRDNQAEHLKEIKINTKSNQELLAYMKQVFGGE